MANYLATARTNYFRVTDEEKYQELFKHLVANSGIEDFTEEENSMLYHGFSAYDSIDYGLNVTGDDFDFDCFLKELQKILPKDEAFIYQESGHEKLRYITGCVIVVTSKEIKSMDISSWAKKTVEELLGKDNQVKDCSY